MEAVQDIHRGVIFTYMRKTLIRGFTTWKRFYEANLDIQLEGIIIVRKFLH